MKTGQAASKAAEAAIRSAISSVEISDAGGRVLVTVPHPALTASATETGTAHSWRIADGKGELIKSGKIGEGLTLDRVDIQWGSVVTIDKIEIEVR
jgi:hypothetical protein